jgi:hypothetical protein
MNPDEVKKEGEEITEGVVAPEAPAAAPAEGEMPA